jgi:hypothetical protein
MTASRTIIITEPTLEYRIAASDNCGSSLYLHLFPHKKAPFGSKNVHNNAAYAGIKNINIKIESDIILPLLAGLLYIYGLITNEFQISHYSPIEVTVSSP